MTEANEVSMTTRALRQIAGRRPGAFSSLGVPSPVRGGLATINPSEFKVHPPAEACARFQFTTGSEGPQKHHGQPIDKVGRF